MRKTPRKSVDSAPLGEPGSGASEQVQPASSAPVNPLRLPSVEKVLASPNLASLLEEFGREQLKQAAVGHLASLRSTLTKWDEVPAAAAIRRALTATTSSSLRRVINGSGVIIHTNLGRSPAGRTVWANAGELVTGYSNLEFDLASGSRGSRDEHLSSLCTTLFGCEAAALTNNNAAATLLLMASVAAGREVLVSRGELVEIGGSFRVPDVIQQGGARLREVGTTNRTRAADYEKAVTSETAALLRVHRSNFEIVGFTEQPSIEELVAVAKKKNIPMLYDEGSGRVVALERYGFGRSATVRELLESGVDAVTISTDKLLGATQGGLILGRREIVDRCRRHPLMRALRAGKESYAVIAATLRAFVTAQHEQLVPIYSMLALSLDELRSRAQTIVEGTAAEVVESRCALGGGTTPTETIESVAVFVPGNAAAIQSRFLAHDPPVTGRIQHDRFTIEMRTLLPEDLPVVAAAVKRYASG